MRAATLDVNDVASELTLTIRLKGRRRLAIKLWLAARLFKLAAWVAGMASVLEVAPEFDPADDATWERFAEETPAGGRVVMVRWPEGYRLRWHGETVWTEPSGS